MTVSVMLGVQWLLAGQLVVSTSPGMGRGSPAGDTTHLASPAHGMALYVTGCHIYYPISPGQAGCTVPDPPTGTDHPSTAHCLQTQSNLSEMANVSVDGAFSIVQKNNENGWLLKDCSVLN